eukprot:1357071-Rhodomonas_salina.1
MAWAVAGREGEGGARAEPRSPPPPPLPPPPLLLTLSLPDTYLHATHFILMQMRKAGFGWVYGVGAWERVGRGWSEAV